MSPTQEPAGAGRRVKLWLEREGRSGDLLIKPGPFTGVLVEREDRGGKPRPGIHIRLDRGGFLWLTPERGKPPAEWSARLLEALDHAADQEEDEADE